MVLTHLVMFSFFEGASQGEAAVAAAVARSGGGRGRHPKRLYVDLDGRLVRVADVAEAKMVLDQAKEIKLAKIPKVVDEIVKTRPTIKLRPIDLTPPLIQTKNLPHGTKGYADKLNKLIEAEFKRALAIAVMFARDEEDAMEAIVKSLEQTNQQVIDEFRRVLTVL